MRSWSLKQVRRASALEEVTAEVGAAFIGAQIGLPADHIEDHASYIASWLEVLKTNPSAFLTAAAKAQTAADYVIKMMGWANGAGALPVSDQEA